MKKIYLWGLVGIIIFAVLGIYLGWLDNGPKPEVPIDVESLPGRFDE